ncbi:MAG: DUF302 domain-containing protein [Candidatus Eisenbacteria bacterium]|nr:DUF302 domain-containing protein [Candidatus Eisenbacteria bacterium]MCC7142160.1 DUF302 domain-containing protein [Candidatus Eisenbacteria bacterium]
MIEQRTYGLAVQVAGDYASVREKVGEALKAVGFGVITEIDMRQTMKQKLEVEFRPYTILGACHPTLALSALEAEDDIGLVMPCNLVIAANPGGGWTVSAIDAVVQLSKIPNPKIQAIAIDVRGRLVQALESLQ